jgi:hypothetical protein
MATMQVLNGPAESPIAGAKWGPPAPQLSTGASAPIRSRACVSRGASGAAAAALLHSAAAADVKQSPSRDSTPRKAERPDIYKFFTGWLGSPVLTTFR